MERTEVLATSQDVRRSLSRAGARVSCPHGTWFQWLPFRQGLNPCLKDILSS
ncbi:MAG TPA: hypothetical protein V6D30_03120 [Leptolyngbyaceae cyanobacterium]